MILSTRKNTPFEKLTYRAVDDSEKIFLMSDGEKSYLGCCFVGLPLTGAGEGTVTKLNSALSLPLPPGSFIQFGILSSPDIDFYTQNYISTKNKLQGLASESSYNLAKRHAELIQQGTTKPIFPSTGVQVMRQRLIFCIKTPIESSRPTSSDIKEAHERFDRSISSLNAAGLSLIQLKTGEFLGIVRLLCDPYSKYDDNYDSSVPLREQIFSPGSSANFESHDTVSFNDDSHFAKLMSIKRFPKRSSI